METTIQISEVNSRDVNTSRGAATVYNVKAVDGKEFSTFKKDLGQQAGQLRGQWATVEYQEVQKGKYTNYYLDAIKPAEGLTEAHTGVVAAPGNSTATVGTFSAPGVTHNVTYKDDKSTQINRSVAFKAAVELVGAGVLTIDGVEDLDKLTSKLIPIVDGTFAGEAPFVEENRNLSSGETGSITDDGILVKF